MKKPVDFMTCLIFGWVMMAFCVVVGFFPNSVFGTMETAFGIKMLVSQLGCLLAMFGFYFIASRQN